MPALIFKTVEFIFPSLITGEDLKLTPEANTKDAAVTAAVDKIKAKLSVDVVLDTDFTVGEKDYTEAKSDTTGSLKITSKSGSKVLTEGKTVTFSLAFKAEEAAKTPVLSFGDEVSQNAVEISMKENSAKKTITIKVENPTKDVKPTVKKSGDDSNAKLEICQVSGDNETYTVELTGKAKTDSSPIEVTVKYTGATKDLTLNVTVKE
ncbi:hypothetical protein [Spiroplasma tabanidicola]|uniref:Uncharacterized protein n=1 Tax=Spiroplasma tabanidicola TaxID=324079 RepID=A0A6I6C971_9MOLU|nr:hypothetical protein [Spiroplasma tabanidicola]QGS51441.1 hypothetical protein STABA_v1c00740 [Spiroplasma tabanidicola]